MAQKKYFRLIALLLTLAAGSCVVPEEEEATPEEPEYTLARSFKTNKNLVVTFSGDKGLVTDFGTNDLGTNPAVFKLNDPYFKELVKIGKNLYKGKVVQGTYQFINFKDQLKSITYVDAQIEVKEDKIQPSSANLWDIFWDAVSTPGTGGTSGGTGSTGGTGGTGSTGGTGTLKWSAWHFIDSDKALQRRYARESGSGEGTYKIKVQYRIDKTDPIHCTQSTCQGYIYWGAYYSKPGGNYDAEYRFYFPNNFTGNTSGQTGVYTLPQSVSVEIKSYSDGSKRIWDETLQMPFAILANGTKLQIYLSDDCVDNKLSNSSAHRCTDYSKGTSTTIN